MDGAVLVGGRGSRMGRDKPLLLLGGVPLARRVAGNMAEAAVFRRVFLAGGDGGRLGTLDLPAVPDTLPGQGPLSGIHAALRAATGDWCVVAACDLPFLPPAFFHRLVKAAGEGGAEAVVPLVGGRHQAAAAAYGQMALPRVEEALAAGRPKMADLLARLRVRYLTEDELAGCGDLRWMFFNLNTPADLEAAERKLSDAES